MKNIIFKIFGCFFNAGQAPASPLSSFLGATGEAISTQDYNISFLVFLRDKVLDFVMNVIYLVCKWALNVVDFFELLVKKMAGIETMADEASYLSLKNPILQFLLSDTIITIFWVFIGVSVALLILLTVVAIVKAEYSEAIQESEKTKLRVYKTSFRAAFLFVLVPIILIGSIVFSNAILNGFYHALTGKEYAATTLGGQIFVASGYEANKYRNYANSGYRIPILINFDDPSQYDFVSSYSPEDLKGIYDSWENGEEIYKMFAQGNYQKFEDTTTYINGNVYNKSVFARDFESFVCTKEQYLVMADFIDFAVKNDVHFYVKCASDADIVWSTKVKNDNQLVLTKIDNYSVTSNNLKVTYVNANNYKDTYEISYNLGVSNNTTQMQDALTTIYQILALGEYEEYVFKYLSKVTKNDEMVDWTTEQVLLEIDGVLTYLPVYEMTYHEYIENYNDYIDSPTKIKGTLLDNGTIFVRVNDKPTLNVVDDEGEEKIEKGEEYYSIYGNTTTTLTNFEKVDGVFDYTGANLKNIALPTTDDGTGKSSYYLYEKMFKYSTYPEKLIRDLNAIYGNINIENFINVDSWSDALGEYVSNRTSTSVGSFNTSLIHPLGLILAEIFLGNVHESVEGTSFSELTFESLYTQSATGALIKTIVGEENYKNVKTQLDFYCELFNMMMSPILDELAYYEGFEVTDLNNESSDLYTFKAYLASLLFSSDTCDYFVRSVEKIVEMEQMIEDLSTDASSASAKFYDFNSLNVDIKNALFQPFQYTDGEIGACKNSIFWSLVISYYERLGLSEEEIIEKFKTHNEPTCEDCENATCENDNHIGRVTADLKLPEYLNSLARYVGIFVWDENYYYQDGGVDFTVFDSIEEGLFSETLINASKAKKYTNNIQKIQKTIVDFTNNYILSGSPFEIDAQDMNSILEFIVCGDMAVRAGTGEFDDLEEPNAEKENAKNIYQAYQKVLDKYAKADESKYNAILGYVESCKKFNQLSKYNLIYGLQVSQSEVLNGTYSVTINNKTFTTQVNMATQKFKEVVYGNQSFAKTLLAKLNSNIKILYANLTASEQERLDKAVAFADNYYSATKSQYKYYKLGPNVIDEDLPADIGVGAYKNFWDSIYYTDKFWDDLNELVSNRYDDEKLYFVDSDYEGILVAANASGDYSCFSALKSFVDGFGNMCFNLNNKTSFAQLMETQKDEVEVDDFTARLQAYFETRKGVYADNTVANLNAIEDYKDFVEFLGIDYDFEAQDVNKNPTASLKTLRLAGAEVLGSYQPRAQDSEAENRMRYLELFYLVCSTYNDVNQIVIDNASTRSIKELAGLGDRPDSELVGLKYTIDFENDRKDEAFGDLFILCTYDEENEVYLPITNGSAVVCGDQDNNYKTFETSYMSKEANNVLIAKGVIDKNGRPTAIREINGSVEFYRDDAKVVDAVSLGIGMYYQGVNDVVIFQTPYSLIANQITKWVTGGKTTLTEALLNAVPMLWVDANLYLPYGKEQKTIYHLDGGSMELNYNFDPLSAIEMPFLYQPKDLNIIILVFGTFALFTMLGNACWGVIKRIYDIVLLFLINPLVISTLPLTEMNDKQAKDSPYAKWRSMIVEKIMSIFGLILGLTVFFLLANMIEGMQFVTEGSKLAEDLSGFWIFKGKNFEFINHVMKVVFLFGAILVIESAPKLFGKIMGFGDIFEEGENVHGQIQNTMQDVKEIVNGQYLSDKIENMRDAVHNMPVVQMFDKMKEKAQDNKFKQTVEAAAQEALASTAQVAGQVAAQQGVPVEVVEAAKQALMKSYQAQKKQDEAIKFIKTSEREKREANRLLRHGYISGDEYKALEGRKKTYSDKEGKRVKARKKKIKKFVKGMEKIMKK